MSKIGLNSVVVIVVVVVVMIIILFSEVYELNFKTCLVEFPAISIVSYESEIRLDPLLRVRPKNSTKLIFIP